MINLIERLEKIKKMWDTCYGDIGEEIDDLILDLQLSQQRNREHHSFAAFRLREYAEKNMQSLSSQTYSDLLRIANLMDNELEFSITENNLSIVRAYVETYLAFGGSLPEKFLDGLWQLGTTVPKETADNPQTIHDYSKSIDNIVEKFIKIISSKDYIKYKK